ncbi:hypothetical protein GIB67_036234 [Kingdonia uniflora]|uniref:PLAT domain-containing protein n=1 Tax=Kingdonia uniflora TaxID=39325 RepID=A0A7J7NTT8_9MAGN|nr:hypothetical protein GIB67_036234 [Kingdonia uniflora]
MTRVTLLLFFLIFAATASTPKAQVKECEYEMVVSTGPTRGPSHKLRVILEAVGGENINTTNLIKDWGAMGRKYTYFLPNTEDRFKTREACLPYSFCNVYIIGKKGELNPHWYINSITVTTKGDGINRLKTFSMLDGHEIAYTNPPISKGECGDLT